MALTYNTSVVRDGLVLHLDAANRKSYNPNLIEWSQTFDNGYWSIVGATFTSTTEIAPNGTPTATTLVDDNASSYEYIGRNITIPNDSSSYTFSIYVKKTTGGTAPGFAVNSGLNGGATPITRSQRLNTDTGVVTSATAIDAGAYWRIYWTLTNNSTGNTNIYFNIYPAARLASGGGDDPTATGSATIWGVQVTRGTDLIDYAPNRGKSGNTWYDISGNGNNATLSNVLYSQQDRAIDLNGTNSTIFASSFIPPRSAHTILISFKSDVALANTTSTSSRITLYKNGAGQGWNPGLWVTGIVIRPHAPPQYRDKIIPYRTFTDWNVLGQIFDGGDVYTVDNGLITLDTLVNGAYSQTEQTGMSIGYEAGTTAYTLDGKISTFQVYDRVLSENEINENYEALRGRYGI